MREREERSEGGMEEFKGNFDCRGMVQSSQQHVASCVKEVEFGFGARGLRIAAAFWVGIPEAQETGIVPRCRRAVIRTLF